MSHEITKTDTVALAKTQAWHGLGIVVEDAMGVDQAIETANLDWEVDQLPIHAVVEVEARNLTEDELAAMDMEVLGHDDNRGPAGTFINHHGGIVPGDTTFNVTRDIDSHQLNIRTDTQEILGVVGRGYTPVQNRDVGNFAQAIADNADDVRVESAGSVKGGKRVWMLMKTETVIALPGDDIVHPYVLLANGHDGGQAFFGLGTSVRVVCNNTLGFALQDADGRAQAMKAFRFNHTANIGERVEEAKELIAMSVRGIDAFAKKAEALAARPLRGDDELNAFFLRVYERTWGMVPTNPESEAEERKLKTATDKIAKWLVNFSEGAGSDMDSAKGTAWGALNALTAWSDHDRTVRVGDRPEWEARTESKLFGTGARFKETAMQEAVALLS